MKRIKKALAFLLLLSFGIGLGSASYAEETEKSSTEPSSSTTKDSSETKESSSAEVQEPYNYKSKEMEEKIKAIPPASATGKKFDGQGTVTDFSTSGSKAFYTITDKDSNVYYLIIDLEKTENNVHFLSDVERAEMQGVAEGGNNNQTQNVVQNPNTTSESQNVTTPTENEKKSNSNGFLFLVLGLAVVGFLAYYFLKFKKNKAASTDDSNEEPDEYEDEDEFYGDEEISEETEEINEEDENKEEEE